MLNGIDISSAHAKTFPGKRRRKGSALIHYRNRTLKVCAPFSHFQVWDTYIYIYIYVCGRGDVMLLYCGRLRIHVCVCVCVCVCSACDLGAALFLLLFQSHVCVCIYMLRHYGFCVCVCVRVCVKVTGFLLLLQWAFPYQRGEKSDRKLSKEKGERDCPFYVFRAQSCFSPLLMRAIRVELYM